MKNVAALASLSGRICLRPASCLLRSSSARTSSKAVSNAVFARLKDPLFLASSVFVKKPERIVALGFIMVLCLLVYRFAEYRLRSQLAQTEQTLPNQIHKPTSTPTMRSHLPVLRRY